MLHSFKALMAVAILAGAAAAPGLARAESAKPSATGAKASSADAAKSQASVDEFEENRRLHTQKSKENNTTKGQN